MSIFLHLSAGNELEHPPSRPPEDTGDYTQQIVGQPSVVDMQRYPYISALLNLCTNFIFIIRELTVLFVCVPAVLNPSSPPHTHIHTHTHTHTQYLCCEGELLPVGGGFCGTCVVAMNPLTHHTLCPVCALGPVRTTQK